MSQNQKICFSLFAKHKQIKNVFEFKCYLLKCIYGSEIRKNIKINETNDFSISAFENQKSEQYTCKKIWYEFFHLGSLICLNLSLCRVKFAIFISKCRKWKIETSTCLYFNTSDFWICCKIRNQNIACFVLENIGHRFPHSKMSTINNRKMDIFVFQHIGFPLDTFIAQIDSN